MDEEIYTSHIYLLIYCKLVILLVIALSTLATIVAEFGDCH